MWPSTSPSSTSAAVVMLVDDAQRRHDVGRRHLRRLGRHGEREGGRPTLRLRVERLDRLVDLVDLLHLERPLDRLLLPALLLRRRVRRRPTRHLRLRFFSHFGRQSAGGRRSRGSPPRGTAGIVEITGGCSRRCGCGRQRHVGGTAALGAGSTRLYSRSWAHEPRESTRSYSPSASAAAAAPLPPPPVAIVILPGHSSLANALSCSSSATTAAAPTPARRTSSFAWDTRFLEAGAAAPAFAFPSARRPRT